MTCATCRFYKANTAALLGTCARWLYGYSEDLDLVPANGIVVEDDEDWGAHMGPDFGCVLWEARQELPGNPKSPAASIDDEQGPVIKWGDRVLKGDDDIPSRAATFSIVKQLAAWVLA